MVAESQGKLKKLFKFKGKKEGQNKKERKWSKCRK